MTQPSAEPRHAISCRACGKLFRVLETPRDAAGRPALTFRMACLKCLHTDLYTPQDIRKI
jgi:hypothetical protein